MSVVRTRKFCCCIPVRAGVILLSILGMIGGGAVTAIAIINLKNPNNAGAKTGLIIQVIVYLLLAVVSLFGLIGAIAKKLGMVRLHFAILTMHLLFSIGTGIYAIYCTFKDSTNYIQQCVSGSLDPSIMKTCNDGSSIMKGVVIGIFVLLWLLELWFCVIVHNYGEQLKDEIKHRSVVKDTEAW